jgi:hypothetical protein
MTDTLCAACGHAHRRHDPEDGNCEAHADVGLGRCPCDVFVAPEDATLLPLAFQRVKVEANKTKLKDALKAGELVDGCGLLTTRSVVIRSSK